jgi:hypothetical protein
MNFIAKKIIYFSILNLSTVVVGSTVFFIWGTRVPRGCQLLDYLGNFWLCSFGRKFGFGHFFQSFRYSRHLVAYPCQNFGSQMLLYTQLTSLFVPMDFRILICNTVKIKVIT